MKKLKDIFCLTIEALAKMGIPETAQIPKVLKPLATGRQVVIKKHGDRSDAGGTACDLHHGAVLCFLQGDEVPEV